MNDTDPRPTGGANVKIYRFKFSSITLNLVKHFSKVHQGDNLSTFKEAFKCWMREHHDSMQQEAQRLAHLGYTGDITEKLYKSIRYYYSKKSNKKPDPVKRRSYIHIDSSILKQMDVHIKDNIYNQTYKPSTGFTDFVEDNYYKVRAACETIQRTHNFCDDDVMDKFKKTYKNRHYLVAHSDK